MDTVRSFRQAPHNATQMPAREITDRQADECLASLAPVELGGVHSVSCGLCSGRRNTRKPAASSAAASCLTLALTTDAGPPVTLTAARARTAATSSKEPNREGAPTLACPDGSGRRRTDQERRPPAIPPQKRRTRANKGEFSLTSYLSSVLAARTNSRIGLKSWKTLVSRRGFEPLLPP
jgi:hypothetical protein